MPAATAAQTRLPVRDRSQKDFSPSLSLNFLQPSRWLNRDNQLVAATSKGLLAKVSPFVQSSASAISVPCPGYYMLANNFMKP